MVTLENYKGQLPAWCPGCGNFPILKTFKEVMDRKGPPPGGPKADLERKLDQLQQNLDELRRELKAK